MNILKTGRRKKCHFFMFYICFQMITGVCFRQFVVAQQALKWQLLNMLHSAWKVLAKLDQGNTVK